MHQSEYSGECHARFHVYVLRRAAWIERESNSQPLESQADDWLRPLGHSEWWWDVFKNLIESCPISHLTFAFFRLWLSRGFFFAFHFRVTSHLTFAFFCLYLRYFAFDFCVISRLFALFRIWLSRGFFFAFDFRVFSPLTFAFFAYIRVNLHLTFAFFAFICVFPHLIALLRFHWRYNAFEFCVITHSFAL